MSVYVKMARQRAKPKFLMYGIVVVIDICIISFSSLLALSRSKGSSQTHFNTRFCDQREVLFSPDVHVKNGVALVQGLSSQLAQITQPSP